jgi:U3 small nucleolar RNA-associated protein 14
VLAAPLPTTVQERLDREAAYEKTKEEGQKWAGVMKRVKEAEHLSFPLQAKERGGVKSAGEMMAGFKPENERESAVQALLNAANLNDKNLAAHEDEQLAAQDLSIEEIAARRAELRHQRELMFRAETRAKRVAKIKSKTFRKLQRKRDAKNEMNMEDMERLDPEAAEDEREKMERQRAKERATLRHGAKSGRWAKDVGGDGAEMEERRRDKEDMLDLKEKLQRKIHGKADGETSSEESEGEDDEDGDVKSKAFDQLSKLDTREPVESSKGLMGMAFMKKAQEREMKKVAEQEGELRKEIAMFGEDASEGSDDEEGEAQMMKVGGNEGRMVFSGPTPVSLIHTRSHVSTNSSRSTKRRRDQQHLNQISDSRPPRRLRPTRTRGSRRLPRPDPRANGIPSCLPTLRPKSSLRKR